MSDVDTDILISGAGIAGLILAALLARDGWRVLICDPSRPPEDADAQGSDLRSTAYLAGSRAVMERAAIWDALEPHAMPLDALRVMDSTGWPPRQTAARMFLPGDLGLESFGWNMANWRARAELARVLADAPGVDLRFGTGFASRLARDDAVLVRLTCGTRVRARLVVGADGRTSPVRTACGIDTRIARYGQKALAFSVTHLLPHEKVSTESYSAGGACVTVPLPDHEGQHASAVVWMNDGPRAEHLAALPADAFEAELADRVMHVLGPMRLATQIRSWPVVTQVAHRLTARRTALVAEAAHVMPPIGAQGLNTSIADIAALSDAISGRDPGSPEALAAYARARQGDIAARSRAIDLFNRVCRSHSRPVQAVRSVGLKAANDIVPLRRALMRAGLGGHVG